ncbi:MAG: TonB-dependent receptor [Bacteroidetes bacterium]|nr:TonB-dependent receptor [Bacteroidota bacterium]
MMKLFPIKSTLVISFLLFIFFTGTISGQKAIITGRINDSRTNESLVGVNVVIDSTAGISTGIIGDYQVELDPGKHTLLFKYIGYKTQQKNLYLKSDERITLNIQLEQEIIELETAVVSAGKFEQKLSDITVSMEIIKPTYIEHTNATNMETVINQMPGVDVMDGQTSIRGGSGYSYGTGSRVLFLVDELPIMSPDAGDVKWNFLPVENIEQVEILKGASSSLYGSSALNGVINIRTAQPGIEPSTKIDISSGVYLKPRRDELAWWWKSLPMVFNASISHLRKIKNMDLAIGANAFSDAGYRLDEYFKRARLNVNFRYNDKKIKGLSYGINANMMYQDNSDFFLWENADSGALRQPANLVTPTKGVRLNLDPFIIYYGLQGDRHCLRTRYYRVTNLHPEATKDKNSQSDQFYGEYQYHKEFKNLLNWTIGATGSYSATIAELYGDHYSSNVALYTQFDWKLFGKLSVSGGLRWEAYKLDHTSAQSNPVVRTGISYQVAKYTFIRASFGQGYRFPSIAEKYASTSLGAINIFPNPDLKSETGWSVEAGVKQGIKLNNWNGYIDIAGFWTQYEDMMEFTFGVYKPDSMPYPTLKDIGFKSLNVGNARINGIDVLLTGQGSLLGIPVSFFLGYTYTNPIDLNADTVENNILKYRFYHSAKGDVELDYRQFSFGLSLIYNSKIINIDKVFEEQILGQELLPGFKEYRQEHDQGFITFDLRWSFQATKSSKFAFIVKNLFNREYMGRPGDIQPPMNMALQYVLKI